VGPREWIKPKDQSALGSACVWFAGHWDWNGCGETECTFYEDNCQVHYDCTSMTNNVFGAGSVIGNTFTFGGGECTATINGRAMSGTCPTCMFSATHR
jgi:hypothetical protein